MKSPKDLLTELARAQAAQVQACAGFLRSQQRVQAILEEMVAEQRAPRRKRREAEALRALAKDPAWREAVKLSKDPEWSKKLSAAIKQYWADAPPEQRAFHGERISEGLRAYYAEKRRAHLKPTT